MFYTFSCTCGFQEDKFQSYKDSAGNCPECGKPLRRSHYDIGVNMSVLQDSVYRDNRGERVWFPKDGKPYYDKALRREFKTVKEKCEYMRKNNIVMDGSSSPKRWPVESGDVRSKEFRRMLRMED